MPLIYVINLDRDVGRMASIAASLKALGLPFRRLSAVLGKDVPAWESLVDAKLYGARNRRPMPKPSEVGCYLSHLKAMEEFLQTEEPWCLILEDDVEVRAECVEVLAA
jgi:glycosyl transferase family 25